MTNKFSRDIIEIGCYIGGVTLEDWREKLLSISEKIGEMVLSVNNAMTKFVNSDAFNNMLEFFRSIPDDIQETELFQHISTLEKKKLSMRILNGFRIYLDIRLILCL